MKSKPTYEELERELEELRKKDNSNLLINLSATIFIQLDKNGIVTFVNNKACEVFGYKEEEILGKNWFDNFIPKRLKNEVFPVFNNLLSGVIEKIQYNENLILTKKDEERLISWNNVVIKDDKGEIIGALSSGQDITDTKKIEKKLIQTTKIIESSPMVVFLWKNKENWPVEFVSQNVERLTGYTSLDFTSKQVIFSRIIHPEDVTKFTIKLEKNYSNNNSFSNEPYRIICKTGDIKWVRDEVHLRKNENGEITHLEGIIIDITEQKVAQQKLLAKKEEYEALNIEFKAQNEELLIAKEKAEKGEEKYKVILNNIIDVYYRADIDGKLIMASPSALKMFGYPSMEEILDQSSLKIIYKNKEKRDEFVSKIKKLGKVENFQSILLRKDGSEIFVETTANILLDKSGNYAGVEGICRDISARKKAEQEIKDSKEYFKEITENISDVISIIDRNGNSIYRSKSYTKLMGFSAEEMIGKNVFEHIHIEDRNKLKLQLAESFKNPEKLYKIVFRAYHKNGTLRYFEGYGKNMINSPIIKGIIINYRDITDKKIMEDALKQSEESYRNLFENNPLSLWEEDSSEVKLLLDNLKTKNITDYKKYLYENPDFVSKCIESVKIINVNKASLKLLGFNSKEELLRKFSSSFNFKSKETFINELIAMANEEVYFKEESEFVSTTGEIISTIIQFQAFDNYKKVVLSVFDISEQKRVEQALKKSEENYRKLNATKDKFFSIIAHDLKGPFNSMLGFSKLLIEGFDDFDKNRQKEFLNYIHQGLQSNYKLLENLLLWSQSQRNTLEFKPEKGNLYLLVEKTLRVLKQSLESKKLKFKNNISENIWVMADKEMLLTIFRNLISNAIKFSFVNNVISITAVSTVKNDNNICSKISICDNGIGIPAKTIPLLFNISKNISTNGTENEPGTGLGLILCKEFVEKHGGKIWAESTEGKGSTFHFTIPTLDNQ